MRVDTIVSPFVTIIGGDVSIVTGEPTGMPRAYVVRRGEHIPLTDDEMERECPHLLAWIKAMRGDA